MAIDVFHEEVVGIAEAARRLPKSPSGKTVHASAIHRWAKSGLESVDGRRVRLETVKLGGRRCTSIEALQRFFDNLSEDGPLEVPAPRWSKRRQRQIQQAEEELRRAGI